MVLGVPRTATVMDVKRAYRKLARRFHPDINPGDHVAALRFKEITEAYETLSDPERRRRYDVLGYQPEPADAVDRVRGVRFLGERAHRAAGHLRRSVRRGVHARARTRRGTPAAPTCTRR